MNQSEIKRSFRDKKVLITAGGTIEPIDPVRFIHNRSSGRMGISLAREFKRYTPHVTLIHANISIPLPAGISSHAVRTVEEMYRAVRRYLTSRSILIMAAAVSDFKVRKTAKRKMKGKAGLSLHLVRTRDILKTLSRTKSKQNIFVGFAAETDHLIRNARKKLREKRLDLIIANPVDRRNDPFGSESSRFFLIDKEKVIAYPRIKKSVLAKEVVKHVSRLISL